MLHSSRLTQGETATVFSKILVQFYSPTTNTDVIKAILEAIKWYFMVAFLSLMTNDVQQLFMCLLAIQRYSFERDFLKSYAQLFSNWVVFIFVIDLLYILCKIVFQINSIKYIASIFSLIYDLPFHLKINVFGTSLVLLVPSLINHHLP